MVEGSSSAFFELGFDKTSESSQQADRMFAVAWVGGTEFVQDGRFSFTRGSFVA